MSARVLILRLAPFFGRQRLIQESSQGRRGAFDWTAQFPSAASHYFLPIAFIKGRRPGSAAGLSARQFVWSGRRLGLLRIRAPNVKVIVVGGRGHKYLFSPGGPVQG